MSDHAILKKFEKKESKTEGSQREVTHPRTSEGILHTALAQKTKDFFSLGLFGKLEEVRGVMYGTAFTMGLQSIIDGSPGQTQRAGIYFSAAVGIGLFEAARERTKKAPVRPVVRYVR